MSGGPRKGIIRLHGMAEEAEELRRRELGLAHGAVVEAEAARDRAIAGLLAGAAGVVPEFHDQYQRFTIAQRAVIQRAESGVAGLRSAEDKARQALIEARMRTRAMQALIDRDRAAEALRQRRRLERDVQERVVDLPSMP